MKRVILTAIIFGVGAVSGILVERKLHKPPPKDQALLGCEAIASSVHEMLTECEWKLSDVQHRFIEQVERTDKLMKIFMPNRLEGE